MSKEAPENVKMWNLARVIQELGTEEKALEFAEKKGFIQMNKMCKVHKTRMSVEYTLDDPVGSFVCNMNPCGEKSRVSRLIWQRMFPENSNKTSLTQWFYLMYAYASEWSYEMIAKEDFSRKQSLSRETIEKLIGFCRTIHLCNKLFVVSKLNNRIIILKIGGPGKKVWIVESNIVKKKFKGQPTANITVMAMLEEGSNDVRLEVCPEDTESGDGVLPLVQRHVADGSIINTSFWQAYDRLDVQYVHKRFENISKETSNPHSECVETKQEWNDLKGALHRHNIDQTKRHELSRFVDEYSWRREVSRNKVDPFEAFLNIICDALRVAICMQTIETINCLINDE